MGEMRILDMTGDTKLIWDAENEDEVDSAKRTFKELTAKGYGAYLVKKDGKPGEKVTKFDPEAEKLILVPVMAGGAC